LYDTICFKRQCQLTIFRNSYLQEYHFTNLPICVSYKQKPKLTIKIYILHQRSDPELLYCYQRRDITMYLIKTPNAQTPSLTACYEENM
jgi:hypothetical protein